MNKEYIKTITTEAILKNNYFVLPRKQMDKPGIFVIQIPIPTIYTCMYV